MKARKNLLMAKVILPALLLLVISTAYAAEQPKLAPAPAAAPQTEMTAPAKTGEVKAAAEQMTVTGTIVANKDKAGKIISYALQEEGGQSLMLSTHGKGMELRKMIGQKVECMGTMQEAKGQKWINVQEFKEIK